MRGRRLRFVRQISIRIREASEGDTAQRGWYLAPVDGDQEYWPEAYDCEQEEREASQYIGLIGAPAGDENAPAANQAAPIGPATNCAAPELDTTPTPPWNDCTEPPDTATGTPNGYPNAPRSDPAALHGCNNALDTKYAPLAADQ